MEELKAAKPLLVYYFVDGLTNASGDDNYEFSRKLEMSCFGNDRVIEAVTKLWRARKAPIDIDADRKIAKNQTRIEFWSFTGTKMGDITLKEQSLLNPGPFRNALKKYEQRNADLCAKEIERIVAREKAQKDAEKDAAKNGPTGAK